MSLWFIFFALVAEIMGTLAGFGSSTILLPIALSFFDFGTALSLVAIFHIFGNIGRVGFFRKGIDGEIVFGFVIPSAIASLIGASLVGLVPSDILKGLLGVFLVLYVLWIRSGKISWVYNLSNLLLGGSVSGFLAGIMGTGGAVRGVVLHAFGFNKHKFIATAAMGAIAADLIRIVVYKQKGFLNESFYWYIPILLLVSILGTYLGKLVVDKLSKKQFNNLVVIALLLVGFKFIYDWLV